jgi:VWFA-related protein
MNYRVYAIVITAVCGMAAASAAQQTGPGSAAPNPQTPTFRLQVEYVEVDVRVTDSKGNFVRDLTKDDFQIFEDGKPQAVAAFSLVDVPVDPSSQVVSIEPDVQSNERRFGGRVYAMLLDDANTAPDRTSRTKNAARRFVEQHLGANDVMAILFTSLGDPAQEFTSDKPLLLSAIDKFVGLEIPARTLPQPIGPGKLPSPGTQGADPGGASDPAFTAAGGIEEVTEGDRVMTTLGKVAAWLDGINGRKKAVIVVSDGFVYDSTKLADDVRPTGRIGRMNVNIYGLDMRGPGTTQTATDQLTMLSENTGGFVVMDNNDIGRGFDRIVAENSTYYLLAYYPSQPRDGKVHSIEVRAKRPGVTVRARRAYAAPKGDRPAPRFAASGNATSATVEALNSPIQLSDLGMRVFAAPFRATPQAQVLVAIELLGRDLPLAPGSVVEISYLAVDAKGVEHGWRTDRLTLNLEASLRQRAEQSGVRVLKEMHLPPGRYQLRVAAHDPARNLSGSVIHDLVVPDLETTSFAVSGVALMSKFGAATVTAHVDEGIRNLLPTAPIAARSFPQDDEIAVFAEVYDDGSRAPHSVEVATTIRSAGGDIVFEETEDRESSELQGARGTFRYTTQIPLETLEPGAYVLSIEASSSLDADPKIVRQVPFRVTAVK